MQIPFAKSTIFENCRNVNINMKYSVKIHGDTICNEGKYLSMDLLFKKVPYAAK